MSMLMTHDADDANIAMTNIRNVIAVFSYLNHAQIHANLEQVVMDIRRELRIGERAHLQRTGRTIALVAAWDAWLPSFFRRAEANMRTFANHHIGLLRGVWQGDNSPTGIQVRGNLTILEQRAANSFVNEQGFYNPV
jgi:hypothetical protein